MITQDFVQEVSAPVSKVFAFVTDFRRNSEWQDGVIESSQTPDGPTAIGTRFKTVRTLFDQKLEAGGEVTQFEQDKMFGFQTNSGPVKFKLTQKFESAGSGTRMTIHVEVEAGGFFKLAEGALAGNLKKQFEEQGAKLKALLEK